MPLEPGPAPEEHARLIGLIGGLSLNPQLKQPDGSKAGNPEPQSSKKI